MNLFLCMTALRNKTGTHAFLPIVRQYKWPSLSRKIVKIQKFAFMVL